MKRLVEIGIKLLLIVSLALTAIHVFQGYPGTLMSFFVPIMCLFFAMVIWKE